MSGEPLLEDRNPTSADVAAETLALLRLLELARGSEFSKPSGVSARWESERVASNTGSDPTASIATDTARMAVRVAVWDAWRAVHDSRVKLAKALAPFGEV